jgi:hypothetical protein
VQSLPETCALNLGVVRPFFPVFCADGLYRPNPAEALVIVEVVLDSM